MVFDKNGNEIFPSIIIHPTEILRDIYEGNELDLDKMIEENIDWDEKSVTRNPIHKIFVKNEPIDKSDAIFFSNVLGIEEQFFINLYDHYERTVEYHKDKK